MTFFQCEARNVKVQVLQRNTTIKYCFRYVSKNSLKEKYITITICKNYSEKTVFFTTSVNDERIIKINLKKI